MTVVLLTVSKAMSAPVREFGVLRRLEVLRRAASITLGLVFGFGTVRRPPPPLAKRRRRCTGSLPAGFVLSSVVDDAVDFVEDVSLDLLMPLRFRRRFGVALLDMFGALFW